MAAAVGIHVQQMQVALESAVQDNTPRLLRLLHDKGACMDAGEGTPSLLQVAMRAGCSLVVLRTLLRLTCQLSAWMKATVPGAKPAAVARGRLQRAPRTASLRRAAPQIALQRRRRRSRR